MSPHTLPPVVLVVDRDSHVRRLLEPILQDAGYAPTFLTDGYVALDHARRHPPAVLVTELLTPRLDGLSLCRLVKSDAATAVTKVLVMSVLASEERSRASGADAFLLKPFSRASVTDALRRLVPPFLASGGAA